jgi:hypothetical protein
VQRGTRIHEATGHDAAGLLALKHVLDRETSFMLLEPGERATTEADERAQLELWMPKLLPRTV